MTYLEDYLIARRLEALSDIRFEPSPILEGIIDVCDHDDFFGLSLLEQYLKKCDKPELLSDDEWERVYPLDSYFLANGFYSRPQMRKIVAMATSTNIQPLLEIIEKERVIHAPIIAHHSDVDAWIVVSGKTRLLLCAYLGIRPEVIKLEVDFTLRNDDGTWQTEEK